MSIISAAGWKPFFEPAALLFLAGPVAREAAAGARFVVVDAWEAALTGRGGLNDGPFLREAFAVAFFGGI